MKKKISIFSENSLPSYYYEEKIISIPQENEMEKIRTGYMCDHFKSEKHRIRKVYLTNTIFPEEVKNSYILHTKLLHPNILKLYQIYKTDNYLLIYENYETDLKSFLESNEQYLNDDLREVKIFRIFFQICLAIDYLHNLNITYGRIYLSNILIDKNELLTKNNYPRNPNIKITQFQKAKEFLKSQKNDDYNESVQNDIFNLGIILYQLFHEFKLPFKETNECIKNNIIFIDLHESKNYEISYDNNISEEALDLMKGMLSKNIMRRITMRDIFTHLWTLKSISYLNILCFFNPMFVGNLKHLKKLMKELYSKEFSNQLKLSHQYKYPVIDNRNVEYLAIYNDKKKYVHEEIPFFENEKFDIFNYVKELIQMFHPNFVFVDEIKTQIWNTDDNISIEEEQQDENKNEKPNKKYLKIFNEKVEKTTNLNKWKSEFEKDYEFSKKNIELSISKRHHELSFSKKNELSFSKKNENELSFTKKKIDLSYSKE